MDNNEENKGPKNKFLSRLEKDLLLSKLVREYKSKNSNFVKIEKPKETSEKMDETNKDNYTAPLDFKNKKLMKKILKSLGVVVIILIATNPSINNLKEYFPSTNKHPKPIIDKCVVYSREKNYFIFSVYSVKVLGVSYYDKHQDIFKVIPSSYDMGESNRFKDVRYYNSINEKYLAVFGNFYKMN